ncbi:MAG: oxygen-independent coproporphyrinogen III oxidase [Epsilonproteobacteria bacterium]|nr:oxygen-independent coproporphyrinogen III oxidase [Campylobacterota bacterium]
MLDFDKFTKYSKPGPRYTSYPTALEFSDAFGYNSYLEKLHTQDSSRPLSLYFHLPFCKNACYFCGCNVVFTSKEDKKERYIDYITRELQILSQHIDVNRPVIQLHFGGGTPTFFDADQLGRLIGAIKSHFKNFTADAEISCEIDPRHINEDQMRVMSEAGFNRVSFGIQDFDDKVQVAVHRVQPYDITKAAMELARGYRMIGMDHFAKPEDELFKAIEKGELHRNFQGYTTKGGADLIGIGLTSIGEGADYYAQNFKDMESYEVAIDAGKLPYERGVVLNEDDRVRKYVIMELMSNFKLDITRFERIYGVKFAEYFADAIEVLKPFEADGLLTISPTSIECSVTGTLLIRNIAMPFDAYMKRHASSDKAFSKTV